MNCETYQDLAAAHVDGVLNPREQQEVELHLATCPTCQRLFTEESRFHAAFTTRRLVVAVPDSVEQRLRAVLVAESTPTLSWWKHLTAFLRPPRLALGLAAAGLFIVLALPYLFSREQEPLWFAQAIDSYQAVTGGRLGLTYHTHDPQELERSLNNSGQLDFVTHVLDLRSAGYHIEGGQVMKIAEHPVAVVLYKGEDGPIVCLRQRGMAPPIPKEGKGRKGEYVYTHAGYTVSFAQVSEHFCILIARLPRETFRRRLGMAPAA